MASFTRRNYLLVSSMKRRQSLATIPAILIRVFVKIPLMQRLSELKRHEELRKLLHISAGCGIAVVSFYVDRNLIIAGVLAALAADLLLRDRLHTIQDMINVGRRSYGDYAYIAGIIVSALLFQAQFTFVMAVLALALGDGLAGLIGRLFGKHHFSWFGADKTILGSIVFFAVTYVVAWHLLVASQLSIFDASIGALILAFTTMLVEASIGYGFDNFGVPLSAGVLFAVLV